jgi:predicted ATPase
MAFVPLAAVTDPKLVLDSVARAVGADLEAAEPLEILAEWFGVDDWLLILDNLEQVVSAAGDLGELLARCPEVVVLVTSRTALGLAAEREYPVSPLPMPSGQASDWLVDPESAPAAALFVERARAVHPSFTMDESNAEAIGEICRRLEGLPLAIELAAARTRILDPSALLERLIASLDALGSGAVDMPERQRTLRATVEWSVGLLDQDERSLLEEAAVFVDGWTIAAAARVAGLDENRALELSEALARHSLIQVDSTADHGPRCAMLETVRAFVAERLTARPDVAQIQFRHAAYYRALVDEADRPLRGAAGQSEWLALLQAEARNLTLAVGWYLVHDPAPLPHMFRSLWPFWHLRDRQVEARPWIEALEPVAASFDLRARVEFEWAAVVNPQEVGDDAAALRARERLVPMLDDIDDPFLHALCQLAMAWSSPITDDFEGALRDVSRTLDELRGQDEPFWTSIAVRTAAGLEMVAGHPDGAVRHLEELRGLAQHYQYDWLIAGYQLEMAMLEIRQNRVSDARDLLGGALDLSLEMRSTRYVTMCLDAFALLEFADGASERAARLAGAAEGLRARAGLRTWPMYRRAEVELVGDIRGALGSGPFDDAFTKGSTLSQRQAVALVRGSGGEGDLSS